MLKHRTYYDHYYCVNVKLKFEQINNSNMAHLHDLI